MLNLEKVSFEEAIAYLRDRVALPSDEWDELWSSYQDAAFSVAGITSADLLNDLNDAIVGAEVDGTTLAEFKRSTGDAIANYGSLTPLTASRLGLIYSQNLDNAYGVGRQAQMDDPAIRSSRPYREWIHIDGQQHPRIAHQHMGGKIFHQDDAIAQQPFPLGFKCHCKWLTVSESELKARGLKPSENPTETVTVRDRITGDKIKFPAVSIGGTLHPIVEPGFHGDRGVKSATQRKELLNQSLDRLPPKLRQMARDAIEAHHAN